MGENEFRASDGLEVTLTLPETVSERTTVPVMPGVTEKHSVAEGEPERLGDALVETKPVKLGDCDVRALMEADAQAVDVVEKLADTEGLCETDGEGE